MKLTEYIIPTVQAQFAGSANDPAKTSGFTLRDFNFLKPFDADSAADASNKFNSLLGQLIGLVLTIAAIVAFFYLVISGFQYITAGGDAGKAQTARQGIINSLIGIIIILVSYLVLRYVGTFLTGER
jgi:hypothetical protein